MGNKNVVYLTQQGLDDLKKELDDLINVRRPENIQAIKEARALKKQEEEKEKVVSPYTRIRTKKNFPIKQVMIILGIILAILVIIFIENNH